MLRAADDAFAGEAGLLQRALLGDVLDVGTGLDPLDREQLEQQLGEQALGVAAVAMATGFRVEGDPDVESRGALVRSVADRMPGDIADHSRIRDALDEESA